MKKTDLTGKKFHRWTVIRLNKNRKKYVQSNRYCTYRHWICRCECGVEKTVYDSNLISGASKSCGCLRYEKIMVRNRIKKITLSSARNMALHALRHAASTRKLILTISSESALNLMDSPCYYCGQEKSGYTKSRGGVFYYHNGIDRVNNSEGYTQDNCVPCCTNCNKAKNKLSQTEFFNLIRRIAEKHLNLPALKN